MKINTNTLKSFMYDFFMVFGFLQFLRVLNDLLTPLMRH